MKEKLTLKRLIHFRKSVYICCFFLLFKVVPSYSADISGSEFSWKCVGKDSFLVKLSIYMDCNGATLLAPTINYTCLSTLTLITSHTLTLTTPVDISPVCKSSCSRCQSYTCTFPYGFQQYVFYDLVDLSSAGSCCDILMNYSACCHSSSITTGMSGKNYYNEALLNRCENPCDNSPDFSNNPFSIACVGQDFQYNAGAFDLDKTTNGSLSDSLVYSITSPLSAHGVALTYNSPYDYTKPVYFFGFPGIHLAAPKGLHMDSLTGDLFFRPMKVESTVLVLEVNEYRHGIKIGTVRRDMELMVINCPANHQPTMSSTSAYKEICAGSQDSIVISTNDLDAGDTVTLHYFNNIPGATWKDNNNKTKHPTGVLKWKPLQKDASIIPYTFIVSASDNECPVPGKSTQAFRILVKPSGTTYHFSGDKCGFYNFRADSIVFGSATYSWNSSVINFSPTNGQSSSAKLYPGIYPFTFKVATSTCSTTYMDTVRVDSFLPVIGFKVNQLNQCIKNNEFIFTNTSQIKHGHLFYKWYFGDGDSSFKVSDTHVYKVIGTYQVRLVIKNDSGCVDTMSKMIKVSPMPVAHFGINITHQCLKGNRFVFTDLSTLSGSTFKEFGWDFGDKTIVKAKDTVYNYALFDIFNIKHWVVTVDGCTDTTNQATIVYPSPHVTFTPNSADQCLTGNHFIFKNNSTVAYGLLTARWDMGDGKGKSTHFDTSYTYADTGSYPVKLIVTTDKGCPDTFIRKMIVEPMPKAGFTINLNEQCLSGNHFILTNTSSVPKGSLTAVWDMGDLLGKSNAYDANYSYVKAGNYQIKLVVSTAIGCKDSVTHPVVVNSQPDADFSINNKEQCPGGNLFVFTNLSTGPSGGLGSRWDFGDGHGKSTHFDTSYSYAKTGIYSVQLIVTTVKGCSDTISKQTIVDPKPVADFDITDSRQCFTGNVFKFKNTSSIATGSLSYKWSLGDGVGTSTAKDTVYSYKKDGIFAVKLVVVSDKGCPDSMIKPVYVYKMPVVELGKDTTIADTMTFLVHAGAGFMSYLWQDSSTNQSLLFDGKKAGVGSHLVWVKVVDSNGCLGADAMIINVKSTNAIYQPSVFKMKIYPNPAKDFVYVEVNQNNVIINILDLTGRKIKNFHLNSGTNTLSLAGLAEGYYLISSENYPLKVSYLSIQK